MFRSLYDSPWQHPGIAFIAGVPLLGFGVLAARAAQRDRDVDPRRRAWLTSFFVLELAILLDAWCTGAWSPFATGGAAAVAAGVVFVVLGDLRFFYLVERQRGEVASGARATLRALAVASPVSLLVPIGTAIAKQLTSDRLSGHALFLVYELAALGLVVCFALVRMPPTSDGADQRRRYVRRLLAVETTLYASWILADALILSGRDLGYLVRMVPNALYYAAFVPLACLGTPAGSRT